MTTTSFAQAAQITAPLFVPAMDERKLRKAYGSAPAVIIDLEDAVADERKTEAREWVRGLEADRASTWVRVNAVDTGRAEADIQAAAGRASVLILPKCESVDQLGLAVRTLTDLSSDAWLLPLIETAKGLQAAEAIAQSYPSRVVRLALGLGDLSRDLRIPWNPAGMMAEHARCRVAVASRAAGLAAPIDSVVPTVGDTGMLVADTARARAVGFGGKFCIHPSQVDVVRSGFAPTEAELDLARRQVDAFIDALAHGRAAVVVQGYFVDYPVAELAESLLLGAGRATARLPARRREPAAEA